MPRGDRCGLRCGALTPAARSRALASVRPAGSSSQPRPACPAPCAAPNASPYISATNLRRARLRVEVPRPRGELAKEVAQVAEQHQHRVAQVRRQRREPGDLRLRVGVRGRGRRRGGLGLRLRHGTVTAADSCDVEPRRHARARAAIRPGPALVANPSRGFRKCRPWALPETHGTRAWPLRRAMRARTARPARSSLTRSTACSGGFRARGLTCGPALQALQRKKGVAGGFARQRSAEPVP